MQQFKLSYRKIYGLAAFIGLADRDRFELSGEDLGDWLESPDKEILLRNQIKNEINNGLDKTTVSSVPIRPIIESPPIESNFQASLFQDGVELEQSEPCAPLSVGCVAKPIDVDVTEIDVSILSEMEIGGTLVGLGFEERTLASNKLLAKYVKSGLVHTVRYDNAGHAAEIEKVWRATGLEVTEVEYRTAMLALPRLSGLALIDISGLSKPLIFSAIRRELQDKGRVLVCHMTAEQHYPLQTDLESILTAEKARDPIALLESLSQVLKGEEGPYKDVKLLDEDVDLSRSRALLAFASAKHERLSSLLDQREFDYVEVVAPTSDEPRARVANYAAEFVCQNFQNSKVTKIPGHDLKAMMDHLDERYLEIYGTAGANIEIGLTGSKIQAVAAAILSARRKVAQAWYLSPAKFDVARFSLGVAGVRIYDITVPE